MQKINLKINGMAVAVPEGTTILEAARQAGIEIPTLCYLKEINEIGACRICVVEIKGWSQLVASCVYPVAEGMEVLTNSTRVRASRKMTIELLLSAHDKACLICPRAGACELQKLSRDYGITDVSSFAGAMPPPMLDTSAIHMVRDNSKCILCRRCVAACSKWQAAAVIGANDRGFETHIGCAFDAELGGVACVGCGQCIVVCPTGALYEKDHTEEVWNALYDDQKHVIVQTAPSIRATLGEAFGMPIGTDVEGKMVAALRRLGFNAVFDTDLGADMTIVEEATEFIDRVENNGILPMITSCSPGWVNYCEHYFPELIGHLSSCKSPQQMFGALAKTWYAKKIGKDPKDIVVVSVMPCTAKKLEAKRDGQTAAGHDIYDVDTVITTRELARMIERAGIRFTELPDEPFDLPMGASTGAGVIFGTTGGVMEAALRTAAEWITGDTALLEPQEVRGFEGVKEASYKLGDLTVNVAVVSGLANAKQLLQDIKDGKSSYHFIEIMACPGGCINGGGQPTQPGSVRNFTDLKGLRAAALYQNDAMKTLRKSHENPTLKVIYEEFLGKPGSHMSHHMLHTHYHVKNRY